MNYTRKIDTDKAVEVQISSFTGKGGTTEYQVMVSITDPCLSFVEQLQNLLRVYVTVVKEELSNDATAVFRRYFLSDAANQTDSVMEWECESAFCPLSIVQQPPLNGTKIAMWTYLQTGMSVQTYDSGLLEASHNGYRHLWGGGAFNKAANSEYVGLSLCPYLVLCAKRRRELRRCGESPERSFYHAESYGEDALYR